MLKFCIQNTIFYGFLSIGRPEIAPYAAIACVIGFLMTGHWSVHPTQVLNVRKSTSIEVEIGCELTDVKAKFQPRRKSLIGAELQLIEAIRQKRHSSETNLVD